MIVMPMIEIRRGVCVRSAHEGTEPLPQSDPVAMAREWARIGFRRTYLVDLDAATGQGNNTQSVRAVLDEHAADVHVGGGIRTGSQLERLLDEGAAGVVIGTRAVEDPDWLAEVADASPGTIVVALDVQERHLMSRGWSRRVTRLASDIVEELTSLPIGGFLVTAIHRVGQLAGTDLALMEDIAEESTVPVYAAGGISTIAELRDLEDRGVTGAIVGTALVTGALDPAYIASEFQD